MNKWYNSKSSFDGALHHTIPKGNAMKHRTATLLLCTALLLSSCSSTSGRQAADDIQNSDTSVITDETDVTEESRTQITSETTVSESTAAETSVQTTKKGSEDEPAEEEAVRKEDTLYLNEEALSEKDSERIRALLDEICRQDDIEVISPSPVKTYYTIRDVYSEITAGKCIGKYEKYLSVNGSYYPWNDELDTLVNGLLSDPDDDESASVEERMYTYTLECAEPHKDEEYIVIGEDLAKQWLDSLRDEEGKYHLGSYKMTSGELWGKGIVGGGREFCVECWFDVSDTGKDSVFLQPEDSGYNTFYHYYQGSGMYIRCRWENGTARIVDHTELFLADLADDLNGITEDNHSGYDTFFDFYNDKEAVEKVNARIRCERRDLVAQSPIMLADGRFSGVAIYPREYEYSVEKDGKLLGVYDNAYYNEYGEKYSSPVDYKDASGACTELYSEHFELLFDDYNCDGNPEFALKQDYEDESEKGARYEVRCMSNDQTPRDTRFDFFMAGRTDECIRLQHIGSGTGETGYVRWDYDENGKMIPSVEVDDYRMYSQRYYLPPSLRGYDDEKQIICYFWNNTDKPVTTGTAYTVEDKNGNVISKGKIAAPAKAEPYRETEITFDADTSTLDTGEYRIGLDCGNSKVYGGFYIIEKGVSISIEADDSKPVSGQYSLDFVITNNGSDSGRLISARLMQGDKEIGKPSQPVKGLLTAGASKRITFITESPLSAGDYYMELDCGQVEKSKTVTVVNGSDADRFLFGGKADAKLTNKTLTITVNAGKATEAPVDILEVKTDEGWQKTTYTAGTNATDISAGKNEIVYTSEDISDEDEEELKELYDYFREQLDEAIKSGDLSEDELRECEKLLAMDPLEFGYYFVLGFVPAEPQSGMRGRIKLGDEYVYFTIQ